MSVRSPTASPPGAGRSLTTRDRWTTIGAVVALGWYVTAWVVAGALEPGYDPANQAISELFDLGASRGPRLLLVSGLLVSAVALVAFGWVLHRCLPRRTPAGTGLRDLAGPAAVIGSGTATGLILLFPCTQGCPGFGSSVTDTGHAIAASLGYGLLVLGPLLIGWRVRPSLPRLAAWSWVLGGAAATLFVADQTWLIGWGSGVAQRVFNTVADVWYVFAGVWLLRGRHLGGRGGHRRRM
ncbi:DUF998 domain-containing protein [Egicoccus halophilus]|uniref:DUF998 domain-containing protein n=1 Tax=Egicoccus halophilus TaxID=1670830 RepID=A0A8J3AA02_9ACTN|nr:DUF998 domain-containing protein [Egicoccus halophilus]GGI05778.1 hypothetical protein GCM10011354_15790 [Egicoccus halophilus]